MKKFTILTLVLAMLLASFSACGDSTSDSSSSVDTAAMEETKETTALEARAAIPDDLPERDYSGANFISLCGEGDIPKLIVEELDGEIVNDATYNMNLRVEERYNVKIGAHSVEGDVRNTTAYIENTTIRLLLSSPLLRSVTICEYHLNRSKNLRTG